MQCLFFYTDLNDPQNFLKDKNSIEFKTSYFSNF